MKKLFYLITLFVLLSFTLYLFLLNDGFCKKNILKSLPFNELDHLSLSLEDRNLASLALSQPYTYLNCGSQCYVFKSQDNRFVLKFFKDKKWLTKCILSKLPPFVFVNEFRERRVARIERTLRRTLESSLVSFTIFKNETGTIYTNLSSKNQIGSQVTVTDRLGLTHVLGLSEIPFIIQHRAQPIDAYLLKQRKEGNLTEAKKAIDLLLKFKLDQSYKGFNDKDPHPIRNFGFLNNQVIEIDNGGFYLVDKKHFDSFYTHELQIFGEKLLVWLEKNYAELINYTQMQLKNKNCNSRS